MPASTKITPELISQVEADYKAGMIQTEILAKHHISYKKLRDILKLPAGVRTFRVHYSKEAVCNDYRNGISVKEIMKKHNIKSYSNVYAIISKEKKRTKDKTKVWVRKHREMSEPTCPIILRLRDKYRNFEQDSKTIGQEYYGSDFITLVTIRPRRTAYRMSVL